jgi:hypothetical protein
MGWAFVLKGFIIMCIFCYHVKLYNKSWRKENRSGWLQPDDHCYELWHIHCGGCVCVQAMSLCWVATALIRLGVYSSFVQVFLRPHPPIFFNSSWYMFLAHKLPLLIKMLMNKSRFLLIWTLLDPLFWGKKSACWVWKYPSVVVVHHRRWEFFHHEWLLVHP